MKKRILTILLALVLTASLMPGLSAPACAEGDGVRTVKMGYFEYANMSRGAAPGAEKSGYVYDFMQMISSYTGWRYEYSYGSYAEVYELLKNGEIDVLPYTNWNAERAEEVLFSRNPIIEEQYYLATRPDDERLLSDNAADLKGKKIATVTGADFNSLLENYLEENGISAEVVLYDDPEESWDRLEDGTVDAAVFSNISYRPGADWNVFCSFGSKPTYIAVSKGNEELLSELDEAFDTLNQTNPLFVSRLEEEVTRDNPAMVCLSARERQWLEEHPVIRVGYLAGDDVVYASQKENGSYGGFLPDLMKNIGDRLGLNGKFDYYGYPTADQMGEALLAGQVDLIYPLYPSFSYAEQYGFAISNAVTEDTMSVVYRWGSSQGSALDKVAVEEGSLAAYYFEDTHPKSTVVPVGTENEAVQYLRRGKVSGVVCESAEAGRIMQSFTDLKFHNLDEASGKCFGAKNENSPLIVLLNRGITAAGTSEINAMAGDNSIFETGFTINEYLKTHPAVIALSIITPLFILLLVLALTAVNRLRRKAQAANEAKTSFLFNMSHDIRTPMNAIIGFTSMAQKHIDDKEKVADCLDKTQKAGNLLLTLINSVLEVSRIESGNAVLEEQPGDVYYSFTNIDKTLGELAESNDVDLSFSYGKITDRYVLCDFNRCMRIFVNVISNAIKYTPAGGKVKVRCEQLGEAKNGVARYQYTVADNGIGMSEEFQKQLFDQFTREQTSTVSGIQGTGLGMSVVKSFVDLMGGTIDCRSKQGEGTTFTIVLPFKLQKEERYTDPETGEEVAGEAPVKAANKKLDFSGRRVLLVEDNELNRELATEILEDEGIIVEEAEDGSIALEVMKDAGPDYYDFILMDIQMPLLDGYRTTQEIREMYPDAKIPIIALSANAFAEDRRKSLEAGMDDHVVKPINIQELFGILSKYLN